MSANVGTDMKTKIAWIVFRTSALIVLLLPACVLAQTFSNIASVVDGSGMATGGDTYSNLSAVAQPGGVVVSSGGTLVNYAGFLNTFSLKDELDTDGDGLANEVDCDNDDDSLDDVTELTGTAFDPNTPTDLNNADSDLDGLSDSEEAIAGTNPEDASASFKLTGVEGTSGITLTWIGRGGNTYDIYCGDSLTAGITNFLHTTNVIGGSSPWYVTTNRCVDNTVLLTNKRFYRITVKP